MERMGTAEIEVPAGRFSTTHYQSERFGMTEHWIDGDGTIVRWASERGTFRWDLSRYPSGEPLERSTRRLRQGCTGSPRCPAVRRVPCLGHSRSMRRGVFGSSLPKSSRSGLAAS